MQDLKTEMERFGVRYKIINGKINPLCDYHGRCKNIAYKEVYLFLMGEKYKDSGWSYLCRKHFEQEKRKFKGKLVYCDIHNFENYKLPKK